MAGSVLEEEAALLAVDDDGIAVQEGTVSGRTEGTDFINVEKAPIRPENGTGLHIAGGIKFGRYLNVYAIQCRHTSPSMLRSPLPKPLRDFDGCSMGVVTQIKDLDNSSTIQN